MDYILQVSDVNRQVKQYLEGNVKFRNMIIEGELSGVTYYQSGHLYFQLKDENAQVKCAAFSYQRKGIPRDLQEGEKVRVFADIGFYEGRGEFQLLVRGIEKQNALGKMYAELEKLKKRMAEEGYFSEKYKKALPKYPKAIGVVTALAGAALQDIIKTIRKRDPRIDIYVYSAKVQGPGAEEEIVEGIESLNRLPVLDFLIAGRGGGAIEDLWAFNKEKVALAFFHSDKPIISAVGHEVDILLSDFTADVRAATPTQAVELSVPELEQYALELETRKQRLTALWKQQILEKKRALEQRKQDYCLQHFPNFVLDQKRELLLREEDLAKSLGTCLQKKRQEYEWKLEKLLLLNPLNLLRKGYSVIEKGKRRIQSIGDLKQKDSIVLRFVDGKAKARVEEIEYEKNEI